MTPCNGLQLILGRVEIYSSMLTVKSKTGSEPVWRMSRPLSVSKTGRIPLDRTEAYNLTARTMVVKDFVTVVHEFDR